MVALVLVLPAENEHTSYAHVFLPLMSEPKVDSDYPYSSLSYRRTHLWSWRVMGW